MKVRLQRESLFPADVVTDVSSVVAYDNYGQPIAVLQQHSRDQILLLTPKDHDFRSAMKALGIGLNAEYTVARGKALKADEH